MSDLKTYTHSPKSGNKPDSMVILLHGLGANGQDLLGLAREWTDMLPDTVFLSPDAPFPCDMAPVGHQWFSLQDWTPDSILRGVKEAAPLLDSYIDAQLKHYDIAPDRLALAGFSQGTMMALYTGPRRAQKIAGVLGYSGALIGEETLTQDGVQYPPICLIHGEADEVVPVAAYHQAREALTKAGFDVSGRSVPGLPHGIDETGIETGGDFLHKVLK